jgi:hypothetical protein
VGRGILGGSAIWNLSILFASLQSLLAQLLWLDEQRSDRVVDLGCGSSKLLKRGYWQKCSSILLRLVVAIQDLKAAPRRLRLDE